MQHFGCKYQVCFGEKVQFHADNDKTITTRRQNISLDMMVEYKNNKQF